MSDHGHSHHISSPQLLIATFIALVALTILTCAQASIPWDQARLDIAAPFIFDTPQDLSWLEIPVTLTIATIKALLVAVIFMHLQHDKLFNSLLLVGAAFFMVLFIGMVLLDSDQYQPEIKSYLDDKAAMANP